MKTHRPRTARTERLPVLCRETPLEHDDLAQQLGVLTLDYAVGTHSPHIATFDSVEEDVDNAAIPVQGLLRSERTLALSDGQWWRFQVLIDVDIGELVHEDHDDVGLEVDEPLGSPVRPFRFEDSIAAFRAGPREDE
ncbi:MAG: hypothetical protein ACOCUS_04630 [Polyangiales bacterium]